MTRDGIKRESCGDSISLICRYDGLPARRCEFVPDERDSAVEKGQTPRLEIPKADWEKPFFEALEERLFAEPVS